MAKPQTQPGRAPTRKQMALSRREKEQLRLIYIGLGAVAALIVIVLAIGLYQTYVLEPNSPVANVNGGEISTREFQNRVRYERFLLDNQIQQMQQQLVSLAQPGNEQLAQMLGPQFEQMAQQLQMQRAGVDRQALDDIIEDRLVEAETQKRGITASPEEVTEAINRIVAQQAGGFTALEVTETATARAEASATAALWTPTPTFTPSPTITPTEVLTPSEAITPTATPANTPTPAPTPTTVIIDENTLKTSYANWVKTLADNTGLDETQYRRIIQATVLKDKLQKAIGDEVPKQAEQAHARHILVETEEEAKKVIERLKNGEDFATLAEELSKDTGSGAVGGDLGFVPQGRFVESVDKAVFSLPIGQVSEPIQSDFGWHVIEVLEREERELSPTDYRQSQRQAYNDWLTEVRAAANVQDFWTVEKVPKDAVPTALPAPIVPSAPPAQ
ncbi:MAG: peptidylprolyl isomerase [Anaerolineae bacterium]|nr:peptidylprolyl isomerase [Anaerolineae bacterium]